jgi:hypothetical protein
VTAAASTQLVAAPVIRRFRCGRLWVSSVARRLPIAKIRLQAEPPVMSEPIR